MGYACNKRGEGKMRVNPCLISRYRLPILIISCTLLSTKAGPIGTLATIYIPVKRFSFYFKFHNLSKGNETDGERRCWKQSKQLEIWYVIGNALVIFITSETKVYQPSGHKHANRFKGSSSGKVPQI